MVRETEIAARALCAISQENCLLLCQAVGLGQQLPFCLHIRAPEISSYHEASCLTLISCFEVKTQTFSESTVVFQNLPRVTVQLKIASTFPLHGISLLQGSNTISARHSVHFGPVQA